MYQLAYLYNKDTGNRTPSINKRK